MTLSEIANNGIVYIIGVAHSDLSDVYSKIIEQTKICGPFRVSCAPELPAEKRDPFEELRNSFEIMQQELSFDFERLSRAIEHCKASITDETHISHHHQSMSKQRITLPYIARKPPYNRRGHRQSYKPPPERNINK